MKQIIKQIKPQTQNIINHPFQYTYDKVYSVLLQQKYVQILKQFSSYHNYLIIGHNRYHLIDYVMGHNLTSKSKKYFNDLLNQLNLDKIKLYYFNPINYNLIKQEFYYISYNNNDQIIDKSWTSSNNIRNHILNDHCLDIIQKKQKQQKQYNNQIKTNNNFMNYLFQNGNQFEYDIYSQLKQKYKNIKIVQICDSWECIYHDKYLDTIKQIQLGTPIIFQGVLRNYQNKTYGCVDILIRSDYINTITKHIILNDDQINMGNKYSNKYHYRIIDIKWSILKFNTDNLTLRNTTNQKIYKSQLKIYNDALQQMQECVVNQAYILGKGWQMIFVKNKKQIIQQINDPFDKLGIIDYTSNDDIYNEITQQAIQMNQQFQQNKTQYDLNNYNKQNIFELCPNMKNNQDYQQHDIKKQIAQNNKEITLLWQCGIKQRHDLFQQGIYYLDDNRINSDILGFKGKTAKLIDSILSINKQNNHNIIQYDKNLFDDNLDVINQQQIQFYIDIEVINNILTKDGDKIFLLGIGYTFQNQWFYQYILTSTLQNIEQQQLIDDFLNILLKLKQQYSPNHKQQLNLYHWSNYEPRVINKLFSSQQLQLFNDNFKWFDLLSFFKQYNIVIKGAYNFSLKSIGNAFYQNKLIDYTWDNDIQNGLDAMYQSFLYYQDKQNNKNIIDKIIKYNEIDCKIMFDILKILIQFNNNLI